MNSLILIGASVITGFVVGGWLVWVAMVAITDKLLKWKQREVRHWQTRAMKAERPDWRLA